MKLIVTGATGLIGLEILRQAINDPTIEEVIALVRKQPEVVHPKIKVILHTNFSDYTAVANYFQEANAIIWSLGISQTQVSKKQYEIITYDYLRDCVQFCKQVNPSIRFLFVSGDGADRTEKSNTVFKRLKGKAENELLNSGLKDIFIVRPGAVNPRHKNKNAPFAYKLVYPLLPLMERWAPTKIVWSDTLAKALLKIVNLGYQENTIEKIALRQLGSS